MGASALLLTHSQDFFTIDRVHAALKRRGVRAVRVDTDLDWHVTATLDRLVLHAARDLDLSRVRAVWARRRWFKGPEWQQCFEVLGRARWVNPMHAEERAESKLHQLVLAKQLGFEVPETIVTDRPPKRRGLITKRLYPTVQSMSAHPDFVYTRLASGPVDRPQIFQPLLEKQLEVRLVVVGDRLFAGAVEARGVDWRLERGLKWRRVDCPTGVARRAKKMLRSLGLVYGAFDFVVLEKNRWVFLELNPAGEYGWLERDLALPISDAIAEALT